MISSIHILILNPSRVERIFSNNQRRIYISLMHSTRIHSIYTSATKDIIFGLLLFRVRPKYYAYIYVLHVFRP